MISTVIFDMDGVIVDSEPIHCQIEMSVMGELGFSVTKKEYQSYVGTTSKDMWTKLIEKYGVETSVDEAIQMGKEKYHHLLHHSDEPPVIPGTVDLIKGLAAKGVKLVLASSSTTENIDLVLNKHGLRQYFAHTAGGDQVEEGKPSPEIFLLASKFSKTLPSQCLVIEDSHNGVTAAKAAGMYCIGYRNPNSGNQLLYDADHIVDDMAELNANNIFDLLQKTKA